jgi:hypothetical protein
MAPRHKTIEVAFRSRSGSGTRCCATFCGACTAIHDDIEIVGAPTPEEVAAERLVAPEPLPRRFVTG